MEALRIRADLAVAVVHGEPACLQVPVDAAEVFRGQRPFACFTDREGHHADAPDILFADEEEFPDFNRFAQDFDRDMEGYLNHGRLPEYKAVV